MHQPTIAVIGAGFSGTVLSLRLRAAAPAGTRIVLIERSGRFGPGLAYGAAGPTHLLNAAAGRMTAFAVLPNDFFHWLRRRSLDQLLGAGVTEASFVPRRLYGAYLAELLELSRRDARATTLELLHDEVWALSSEADHLTLRCAGGRRTASIAVLAVGHAEPPAPHPAVPALAAAGLWHNNPWLPAAMSDLEPGAPVLLVGTGLTMVDAALSLLDSGRPGPIHALSPHGLLPRAHLTSPVSPAILPDQLPAEPRGLLRLLRREVDAAAARGLPWQPVIDALRPRTAELWQSMGAPDRRRFLRHLSTYWDIHRHRMPASEADRIAAAQATGQLRVHAGRIVDLAHSGRDAVVTWCRRGSSSREVLFAARVINCCGQAPVTRSTDRLLRSVLWGGLIRPDPLDIGLDVTPDGAVLDRLGMPSDRLFAIGPLTRSTVWDGTSVPELRQHCERMARTLSHALSRPVASSWPGPGARTNPAWPGVMSPS